MVKLQFLKLMVLTNFEEFESFEQLFHLSITHAEPENSNNFLRLKIFAKTENSNNFFCNFINFSHLKPQNRMQGLGMKAPVTEEYAR